MLLAVAAGMLFSLIVLAPFFWQVELQANGSSLTYEKFIGIGLTPATLLAAFAWAFLHQGLPEEMFFRGFLLGQLTRRFRPLQTNVIQAVVFWLLHFPGFILLGRAVGSGSGIKTTAWPDRC